MKTVVLAFDIERTGAKPENETIGIGLSVVDENFKQLDSLLLKGYISRPIPEEGAPEGFELRSWVEFWQPRQEVLKTLTVDFDVKEIVQKTMIIRFQEFRKKWEYRAEDEGFNLEICSDNPVYDCWFINELICRYLPEYHPLPYKARSITYQPIWDTDSMLRGVLAATDPEFKSGWGLSDRIRELYDVKTEDIGYDHLPHHDAYNIACDAQIILGIREGRIKKKIADSCYIIYYNSETTCGDGIESVHLTLENAADHARGLVKKHEHDEEDLILKKFTEPTKGVNMEGWSIDTYNIYRIPFFGASQRDNFIKEVNEGGFPYQIVVCGSDNCDNMTVGDREQWPSRGTCSCATCDKTWCVECSKNVKIPECDECFAYHCATCDHAP
jgi:hypothetical protein